MCTSTFVSHKIMSCGKGQLHFQPFQHHQFDNKMIFLGALTTVVGFLPFVFGSILFSNLLSFIDFLNPSDINQMIPTSIPAKIDAKLPPKCEDVSIEYKCRGKKRDFK